MVYVSNTFRAYIGQTIGDGQCVAYVKEAANTPITSQWNRGRQARTSQDIAEGTAIATFGPDGRYENVPGRSHAAIYVRRDDSAIYVFDQWSRHPVAERAIRFGNHDHGASNDGDAFCIIE
ncbi:MAG: BPSL0067 family protein [Polyangiales bacterium]